MYFLSDASTLAFGSLLFAFGRWLWAFQKLICTFSVKYISTFEMPKVNDQKLKAKIQKQECWRHQGNTYVLSDSSKVLENPIYAFAMPRKHSCFLPLAKRRRHSESTHVLPEWRQQWYQHSWFLLENLFSWSLSSFVLTDFKPHVRRRPAVCA